MFLNLLAFGLSMAFKGVLLAVNLWRDYLR